MQLSKTLQTYKIIQVVTQLYTTSQHTQLHTLQNFTTYKSVNNYTKRPQLSYLYTSCTLIQKRINNFSLQYSQHNLTKVSKFTQQLYKTSLHNFQQLVITSCLQNMYAHKYKTVQYIATLYNKITIRNFTHTKHVQPCTNFITLY